MIRRIAAALGALLFFANLAVAMNRLALAAWPAYAVAFPSQDFSPGMLAARLVTAVVALIGSGIIAAHIARGERIAVVIAAATLLLLGGAVHLTEPTWSHFPLWYHLAFLGLIAPCVLIGGGLRKA